MVYIHSIFSQLLTFLQTPIENGLSFLWLIIAILVFAHLVRFF